jgi:hypothetical protein
MRRFSPWICLFLVFLPLTVTSTPPAQAPLNSYRLDGRLLSPRGQPIAGATVTFATHCQGGYLFLDKINGCTCYQQREPGHPSDVTAADGSFTLDLVSCELFDSLAVAVVEPTRVVTRNVVAVQNAQQQDWNQQVPGQTTSYFFCATSTGFSTVRVGSVYTFSSNAVTMTPASR